MPRLKAKNLAKTTLAADMGPSDTSCTVADGSVLPDPPFRITVEDEIIEVTEKDGNTLSGLIRGCEGTTPASHSAGTIVENRWTVGYYEELASRFTELDDAPDTLTPLNYVRVKSDGSGLELVDRLLAPDGTASAPGFAFRNDPDTGIYRAAADKLAVVTGGVDRVTVDEGGNVGIGTTAPDYKLHVIGDTLVTGTSYLESTLKKATAGTTQDMTIWVDADNGSDTTGDGSESNPYQTISKAFSTIPEIINHVVTIKLKAATSTYSKGYLAKKNFGATAGKIILEGTMNVLDSGTVSSVTENVADPVYGADVPVDQLTDTTKSWTANAFKYKLLRVYKAGVGEQYRIIIGNDATSLYVSHHFSPVPDNTWSYEILDWGSVVDGLDISYLNGPIEIKFVHSLSASAYPLRIIGVPSAYILGCRISKNTASALHAFSFADAFIRVADTYIDNYDNTNYDGIVPMYGRFSRGEFYGTIVKGFRYGFWVLGVGGTYFFRDGSRILKEDSTISQIGVFVDGSALLSFYSPLGKVVIDNGATGIKATSGARFLYDNYIYFGSTVTTPRYLIDGIDYAGNINFAVGGGNVGIGTTTVDHILQVVQGSPTDPIADTWNTYSCSRDSKTILREVNPHGYLDRLVATPIYEWSRSRLRDEKLQRALVHHELRKQGKDPLAEQDKVEEEVKRRLVQLKPTAKTAIRVGPSVDEAPPEILAYNPNGNIAGIDLLAYCGFLHACIRELTERVVELEKSRSRVGERR